MRVEETYGRHWSAADDAVLRDGYGRVPAADLAARVGRGAEAVRQRARALGLAKPVTARITWTAEADATLRAGYRQTPVADLATRLGTTAEAVWKRAQVLGLATPRQHDSWSDDDDRLLRDLYGAVRMSDIVARLGRARTSVFHRLATLGLTREAAVAGRQANDQAEIARLRAENDHLKHGALDAAHAPTADARRLAVLMAYRMQVIDATEAAVVLGVVPERLPVELGKAAKLGLDVVEAALKGGR